MEKRIRNEVVFGGDEFARIIRIIMYLLFGVLLFLFKLVEDELHY